MKIARIVHIELVFLGVWGASQPCWTREVGMWTLTELHEQADLVVVANSGETTDGTVAPPVGHRWEPVVTTFNVRAVFKTDPQGAGVLRDGLNHPAHKPKRRVLEEPVHPIKVNHFRYKNNRGGESNGPEFVQFDGKSRSYLLFLKHAADGHYEFLTGPWDPDISIRTLGGYKAPDPQDIGDEPNWTEFHDEDANVDTAKLASDISKLPAEKKEAARKRLELSLKSPKVGIRLRAAVTLKSLGDDRGVLVVIADFPKTTGHYRNSMEWVLRSFKDRRAIPVLREAAREGSSVSLAALGELKATEAFDDIVVQLKHQGTTSPHDGKIEPDFHPVYPADYACQALGMIGDMRAVPILIDYLKTSRRPGPARHALEMLMKQHEEQVKQKMGNDPEKWAAWWKKQRE